MDNLEKAINQLEASHLKAYELYERILNNPGEYDLHELVLLANRLSQDRSAANRLNQDPAGSIYDIEVNRYINSTYHLLDIINNWINAATTNHFYSPEDIKGMIEQYQLIDRQVYELCRKPFTPEIELQFRDLAAGFGAAYREIETFVDFSVNGIVDSKIMDFLNWFECIMWDINDEIVIDEIGFFDDPVYVKFWNRFLETGNVHWSIVEEYKNLLPKGTSSQELFRYIPRQLITQFVNLCKFAKLSEDIDFKPVAVIKTFENKEFAKELLFLIAKNAGNE